MAPDRVVAALETLDRRDRGRNVILGLLLALALLGAGVAGLALWLSSQSHSNDEQAISTLAFRLCQHDLNDALDAKFRQDARAFFAASTPAARTAAIAALATPEPKIHLAACGPVKLYEITVPVPVPAVSPTGTPTSSTTLSQGIPSAPAPAVAPTPTTTAASTTTITSTTVMRRRPTPAPCTTIPVTKSCLP